eukprot:6184410-Pleurochrysis_carterae.AAC.8
MRPQLSACDRLSVCARGDASQRACVFACTCVISRPQTRAFMDASVCVSEHAHRSACELEAQTCTLIWAHGRVRSCKLVSVRPPS